MNRLCIFFLAFLTLWVSTWLVTDVHEWSMFDDQHTHTLMSIPSTALFTEVEQGHHSGICSYDHGGHIGQAIVTILNYTALTPTQSFAPPHYSALWQAQIAPQKSRPPIV